MDVMSHHRSAKVVRPLSHRELSDDEELQTSPSGDIRGESCIEKLALLLPIPTIA